MCGLPPHPASRQPQRPRCSEPYCGADWTGLDGADDAPAGGTPEDLPGLQSAEACGPAPESTDESAGESTGRIARFGEREVFFHVANLADPDIPVETGHDTGHDTSQCVRFRLRPSHRRHHRQYPGRPATSVAIHIHRIAMIHRSKGDNDG